MVENLPAENPPVTGNTDVDAALAGVGDVTQVSAADALVSLTAAQEALARVLEGPIGQVQGPIPGLTR